MLCLNINFRLAVAYPVVNSNSIACGGKSSVTYNLFSGRKLIPVFSSVT
jgi:hypothetical protein